MGGAEGPGNATPGAEYNFWWDPEAAYVVMQAVRQAVRPALVAGLMRCSSLITLAHQHMRWDGAPFGTALLAWGAASCFPSG